MKGRRLELWYRVECNGDDEGGCSRPPGRHHDYSDFAEARRVAVEHATECQHEALVSSINVATVYDGRVKRK